MSEGRLDGGLLPQGQPSSFADAGPIIRADAATFCYRKSGETLVAVENLNWTVDRGKITALIGPSGCGKSTLIRGVCRVHKPSSGSLTIDIPQQPSVRDLAVAFQTPALLPWLDVEANAWLPFKIANEPVTDEDKRTLDHLLETTELHSFRNAYPHELSGGMAMRAAVIRAFLSRPRLVLMDEPFSALDELTRERMCSLLERIWMETQNTVVFVTHNLTEAVLLSDKVSIMSARPGKLVTEIDIPLARPRLAGVQSTPDFLQLVSNLRQAIRNELNHEG